MAKLRLVKPALPRMNNFTIPELFKVLTEAVKFSFLENLRKLKNLNLPNNLRFAVKSFKNNETH